MFNENFYEKKYVWLLYIRVLLKWKRSVATFYFPTIFSLQICTILQLKSYISLVYTGDASPYRLGLQEHHTAESELMMSNSSLSKSDWTL